MSAHRKQAKPSQARLRVLDQKEGEAVLERQARRYFDMSGAEFIKAWKSGKLDSHPDQSAVTYVAMLIPLLGKVPD